MKQFGVLALVMATSLPVAADELNWFDWSSVAPIVVAVTSLGENGRFTEVRVIHAFRGDMQTDEMLRIDVKGATHSHEHRLIYVDRIGADRAPGVKRMAIRTQCDKIREIIPTAPRHLVDVVDI